MTPRTRQVLFALLGFAFAFGAYVLAAAGLAPVVEVDAPPAQAGANDVELEPLPVGEPVMPDAQ